MRSASLLRVTVTAFWSVLFFTAMLSLSQRSLAQSVDTSILPPDRATTWNPGLTAVGGIPTRTTVCATLAPRGAGLDDTPQIQGAINACPAGQVVQLAAGTFNIQSGPIRLNKSNITLRGSGPTQTTLLAPDGTNQALIVIGQQWAKILSSTNLATDAIKGSNSVTVASTAGLTVGLVVLIDKLTDTSITFWASDCGPGTACQGWFSRTNRPITQMMEIASISGNTVTFTTPFHITFDVAHTAQLSTFNVSVVPKYAGVENLKGYGGEGGDGGGNFRMEVAAYSWVRNVESQWSVGASGRMYYCFRCEMRDSYFHQTKNPNPGGAGYGIDISVATSDSLVENNISWLFNKVILMRAAGGGNVVAYNYFEDGYGAGYLTMQETGLNASHMTTSHYVLFEGNQSFNFGADTRWGSSAYITFFRNHSTTLRRDINHLGFNNDSGNRFGIDIGARHYYYSMIGNVIGYSGMNAAPYSGFEYQQFYPWTDGKVPMWRLGHPDSIGTPDITTYDPNVQATMIRDGNFDYATNTVNWDRAVQPIPNSLYLTSKPGFFGNCAWPWIDSLGSTKVNVLPARARFDGNPTACGSVPAAAAP
jgi:hypothetical protein